MCCRPGSPGYAGHLFALRAAHPTGRPLCCTYSVLYTCMICHHPECMIGWVIPQKENPLPNRQGICLLACLGGLEQAQGACALHGLLAAVHVQLVIDVSDVRAHGVPTGSARVKARPPQKLRWRLHTSTMAITEKALQSATCIQAFGKVKRTPTSWDNGQTPPPDGILGARYSDL